MQVAIVGLPGSGKTTVTRVLKSRFGEGEVTVLEQDHYYRRPAALLSLAERAKINYDHPSAFDEDLLVEPTTCWYVGDSIWDMKAAVAAKMTAIGVLAGAAVDERALREAGASVVVTTLGDIAAGVAAPR